MASLLHNKINSYAIENGIEFDQAFAIPPTQTGTIQENTSQYWQMIGRSAVYEPTVGPPGGSGSWKFLSNSSNFSRLRNNGGAILTLSSDGDYSIGFWAKVTQLRQTSEYDNAIVLLALQPNTTTGFSINISGGATPLPNRVGLTAAGTTTVTNTVVNTTNWYYFAVTKNGTNLNLYVNNQLVDTRTNMQTATSTVLGFGDNAAVDTCEINISNFYYASTSVIGTTQIAEIWAVGSTAPATVNYSASPMTASGEFIEPTLKIDDIFSTTPATATALIMHPTIITTIGDSTYVTTSFIASALSPSNVSVFILKNNNFTVTEILEASVELVNNVIVSTGSDVDFSAPEFTASGIFVEPFIARQPMTASATMPGGNAAVQANYYNLVKSLDPVFYYNFRENTMQNYGSWNISSYTVGSTVTKNQTSPGDLAQIDNGKSWKFTGNYFNAPNRVEVYPQSGQNYVPKTYNPYAPPLNGNPIIDLVRSRSFAVEYWFTTNSLYAGVGFRVGNIDIRFKDGIMGYEIDATLPGWSDSPNVPGPAYERIKLENTPKLLVNDWNHIVINVTPATSDTPSGFHPTDQTVQFWVNSYLQNTVKYTMDYTRMSDTNRADNIDLFHTADPNIVYAGPLTSPTQTVSEQGTRGFWQSESSTPAQVFFDEVAIYDQPLTSSQIIDHYSFIYNQSPDRNISSLPLTASATSGDHAVLAIDNVTIAETPATANALFVNPAILAVKNLSTSATPLTASATNTDVTVYYGRTMTANIAIATAEIKEGFALNTTYYDYIQANIAPYRYVNFDTATPLADFGSDTDYAVSPTVVGGIIVNPDLGINGKSAKTAGLDYVTDGVILKESEHDDNWGTGNNSWHSSFWVQRAIDDTSTTGLRILWNLNGHNDNQNVILYHYQNKLHLQINNQVGAPITITSANNVNIFDYDRHNIVINSHHNNNKNHVYVYVDTVLVLDQDINTYAVTTINNPIHVGANDEANNFARLSVGCLITPFAYTALPVMPANTKLIVDEIYWDKNQILQTQVTNIFNVMPEKINSNFVTLAFEASTEIIMPAISTTVNFVAAPATASAQFVDPSLFIVRHVIIGAETTTASALMTDAIAFAPINITADLFIATALFNDPGVIIAIPAQPMLATVDLINRKNLFINNTSGHGISITTNGMTYELREFSPYIRYLRIVARNQKIYKDMEIL